MNGIHDMGGMHGMGPIRAEKNEPVFHEKWEGRMFALALALDGADRDTIERIPPAEYLRQSYYERWLTALEGELVKAGTLTPAEMERGKAAGGAKTTVHVLTATEVPAMIAKGEPSRPEVRVEPQFHLGQRVRARNMHPVRHTRLPRYVRGRVGTVERDYGVFEFPDTSTMGLGPKPQRVYSVRFAARELWGAQAAPQDSVYVDMWDDYLEPA